jgi:hypothetical protein
MKKIIIAYTAILLFVLGNIPTVAAEYRFELTASSFNFLNRNERCVVSDPTGTPLNIRATPNGKVVGKVRNGTTVYAVMYSGDSQDRSWTKIKLTPRGAAKGWVLTEFLECD